MAVLMPKVLRTILLLGCIYITGLICNFTYTRLMTYVTQGTLKNIRDTMFSNMQKLPIKYFDTHPHGDIMSYYTNDTETLRQLIAESIPSLISSSLIVLVLLGIMMYYSIWLMLIVLAGRGGYGSCHQIHRRQERPVLCQAAKILGKGRRLY